MPLPPIDAEAILKTLGEVRESVRTFAGEEIAAPHGGESNAGDRMLFAGAAADDATTFDYLAVQDALESIVAEVSTAIDRANARLLGQALEVYYAAEELARDREHAELLPRVEEMRRAYECAYGVPIPPRPQKS